MIWLIDTRFLDVILWDNKMWGVEAGRWYISFSLGRLDINFHWIPRGPWS